MCQRRQEQEEGSFFSVHVHLAVLLHISLKKWHSGLTLDKPTIVREPARQLSDIARVLVAEQFSSDP
jgi:hypothetical protein